MTGSTSQPTNRLITTTSAPLYLAWVNVPREASSIESEFQDIDELVRVDEQNASRRQHLENARRRIAEALPQQITGIASLRLRKGWSQQRLAQEIGTSQPHIARIEGGQDILLDTARRLAKALDVSLLEIDAATCHHPAG